MSNTSSVSQGVQRRARELLATRPWTIARNPATGVRFFVTPSTSQPGVTYRVHALGLGCSCPAYQDGNVRMCVHMLAVRLHLTEERMSARAATRIENRVHE